MADEENAIVVDPTARLWGLPVADSIFPREEGRRITLAAGNVSGTLTQLSLDGDFQLVYAHG